MGHPTLDDAGADAVALSIPVVAGEIGVDLGPIRPTNYVAPSPPRSSPWSSLHSCRSRCCAEPRRTPRQRRDRRGDAAPPSSGP
jgi:hypothetical protein